jgi:hypothetical protein
MSQTTSQYSFKGIYLPKRKLLTDRLQIASFAINDTVLIISISFLFVWFINIFGGNIVLPDQFSISPLGRMLFIFSSISVFFSAKKHIYSPDQKHLKRLTWILLIPIFFASITALFGFLSFTRLTSLFGMPFVQTTQYSGFCFFLIGLALIPPFTRISHRFHVTQALLFIVIALNAIVILESVYQTLSPFPMQQIFSVPLITAILLSLFCFGILCRWSNRGFVGNFTLDSVDSILALRLVLVIFVFVPLIGFLVLLLTQNTLYNVYEVVTLIVVFITITSFTILWINIQLLYNYDLEYFLMKEALRVYNIDLKLGKEKLEKEKGEIEKTNEEYRGKLNNQKQLEIITEGLA